jgi:hypothetical protein
MGFGGQTGSDSEGRVTGRAGSVVAIDVYVVLGTIEYSEKRSRFFLSSSSLIRWSHNQRNGETEEAREREPSPERAARSPPLSSSLALDAARPLRAFF